MLQTLHSEEIFAHIYGNNLSHHGLDAPLDRKNGSYHELYPRGWNWRKEWQHS